MRIALPACLPAWLFPFTPACSGQYTYRRFWRLMLTTDTFQSGLPIPLFTFCDLNGGTLQVHTSKFTDSMTSRNTSFFLYLIPSERQDTALVTAIGGLGATSSFCPSWVMYLRKCKHKNTMHWLEALETYKMLALQLHVWQTTDKNIG